MMNLRCFGLVGVLFLLPSCSGDDQTTLTCVVVKRMDESCAVPISVSSEQMAADGCLQKWDQAYDSKACPGQQERNLESCPENFTKGNWTRLATQNGSSCTFRDECQSDGDCVAATNKARSCACPQWVPRQLLAENPCYVTSGQSPGGGCKVASDALGCDNSCPSVSGSCSESAGYRKCIAK